MTCPPRKHYAIRQLPHIIFFLCFRLALVYLHVVAVFPVVFNRLIDFLPTQRNKRSGVLITSPAGRSAFSGAHTGSSGRLARLSVTSHAQTVSEGFFSLSLSGSGLVCVGGMGPCRG